MENIDKAEEGIWLDAWHVNPSANKEYALIDGLRGIAILIVVIGHQLYFKAKFYNDFLTRFLYFFIAPGYGVTIFFALSGFLISLTFWKLKINGEKQVVPCGYGWRRFWKIYPPLALSVVLFAAVGFFRSGDFLYVEAAAKWLTGWPLLLQVTGKLNSVMWSLVVEVQFYILLPLLFLSLKKTTPSQCRWLLFLIFALVPSLIHWSFYGGRRVDFSPNIDTHFPANLDSFAFGIFVAGLECQRLLTPARARFGDIGFSLLFLTLAASAWLDTQSSSMLVLREIVRWCAMGAGGLLILYIADPQHPRSRLLCHPWLRWCGFISFELYLFHQPMIGWIRVFFGRPHGNVFKLGLQVTVTTILIFIVAAFIYKFFSLPILKYGRCKAIARPSVSSC